MDPIFNLYLKPMHFTTNFKVNTLIILMLFVLHDLSFPSVALVPFWLVVLLSKASAITSCQPLILLLSLTYKKFSSSILFKYQHIYWSCGASIFATDCSKIPPSWSFHFIFYVTKNTKAGKILRVQFGWTIKETFAHVHMSDHYLHHPQELLSNRGNNYIFCFPGKIKHPHSIHPQSTPQQQWD